MSRGWNNEEYNYFPGDLPVAVAPGMNQEYFDFKTQSRKLSVATKAIVGWYVCMFVRIFGDIFHGTERNTQEFNVFVKTLKDVTQNPQQALIIR